MSATTSGAGAQTISSTSANAVTVTATANGGTQTITTGSGNDTITLGSSSSIATINGGAGADTIILGATHTGVNHIVVTPGQSTQTGMDTITNFNMIVSDTVALGSTKLLTTAQLTGTAYVVTNGLAHDAPLPIIAGPGVGSGIGGLSGFLFAATTSTTAGVVAYSDGTNTYVVASDGLSSGAADTVVKLVGVTNATAVGSLAAQTTIHIV